MSSSNPSISIDVMNSSQRQIMVSLEPWASERSIAPMKTVKVRYQATGASRIETIGVADGCVSIWFAGDTEAEFVDEIAGQ